MKTDARRMAARKAPARKAARQPAPARAKTPARKPAPLRKAAPVRKAVPVRKAAVLGDASPAPSPEGDLGRRRKAPATRHAPALDRERRTVGETAPPSTPSSFVSNRHASAASSGADEMRVKLATHTGSGPAITAGDVDANWEAAESVGDEAPGGDNPTPDQDVVDEIGRALGVE